MDVATLLQGGPLNWQKSKIMSDSWTSRQLRSSMSSLSQSAKRETFTETVLFWKNAKAKDGPVCIGTPQTSWLWEVQKVNLLLFVQTDQFKMECSRIGRK